MTPKQYNAIISAIGWKPNTRTAQACKLVLVDGMAAADAAIKLNINKGTVSRGLDRIAHFKQCPTCGQEIKGEQGHQS